MNQTESIVKIITIKVDMRIKNNSNDKTLN